MVLNISPRPPGQWIEITGPRAGEPTPEFYRYMVNLLSQAGGSLNLTLQDVATVAFSVADSQEDVDALRRQLNDLDAYLKTKRDDGLTSVSPTDFVGILPVSKGGTGQSSFTDGQLLIGDSSTSGLDKGTLTAGSNVTISNAHGSITINATAGGGANYSTPVLSSFAWVNQGTSSATQTVSGQAILLNMATNATLNWRIMQQAQPATPYKVLAQLSFGSAYANSQTAGIYFYDGTKLMGIELLTQSAFANTIRVEKITNVTTDSSTAASSTNSIGNIGVGSKWYQLRNDGVTLSFDYSADGQNFINLFSEAIGTFITPTAIGFGGAETTTTAAWYVGLFNWSTRANANLNG